MTTINAATRTDGAMTGLPVKARVKGHERFAVHRHIVGNEAAGKEFVVTHARTGLSLTAHGFVRLQPARQVARGADRVLAEVGDFGETGKHERDADGFRALARYHEALRDDRPWFLHDVTDEMVDAWVRYVLT